MRLRTFLLLPAVGIAALLLFAACAHTEAAPARQGTFILAFEQGVPPVQMGPYIEVRSEEVRVLARDDAGQPTKTLFHRRLSAKEAGSITAALAIVPPEVLGTSRRKPPLDISVVLRIWTREGMHDPATSVQFQNVSVRELVPLFVSIDHFLPEEYKVHYEFHFDPDAALRFFEADLARKKAAREKAKAAP